MRVCISVRPVLSELKIAIEELFAAMPVKFLQVESDLVLGVANFVKDFLKNVDEVKRRHSSYLLYQFRHWKVSFLNHEHSSSL